MSIRFTIGFSNKEDLSDFDGTRVNYDGYPASVLPSFIWLSRFGRFSDLVDEIKNVNSAEAMNYVDEILEGKSIFDAYPKGERPSGRDDFFTSDFGYVINSKDSITVYRNEDDKTTINLTDFDWHDIYNRMMRKAFDPTNKTMYGVLYDPDILQLMDRYKI